MRSIKTKLLLGLVLILSALPLANATTKPQARSISYYIEFEKPEVGIGNSMWFQVYVDYVIGSENVYFTGYIRYWFSWQPDLYYSNSSSEPGYLNIINPEWNSTKIPFNVYGAVPAGIWNITIMLEYNHYMPISSAPKYYFKIEDIPFTVVDTVTETTSTTSTASTTGIVYKTTLVTKETVVTKQTADFVAFSFIALALIVIALRQQRKT